MSGASGTWTDLPPLGTGFAPPPPPVIDPNTGLPESSTPPPVTPTGVAAGDSISQANLIAAQLRQANASLIALEQSLVTNQGNPDYVKQMAPGIQNARSRYGQILQAYIYAYGVAFGNPPDTTGLSQWAVYIGAGVALAAVLAAAYEINNYIGYLKQQQSNITLALQNSAYAMQQCHAAQQAGDTASAAQWCAIAQQMASSVPSGSGFSAWLSENWAWLAAGAAALVIVPDLL